MLVARQTALREGQRAHAWRRRHAAASGHDGEAMAIALDVALAHLTSRKRQTLVSLTGVVLGVAFFLAVSCADARLGEGLSSSAWSTTARTSPSTTKCARVARSRPSCAGPMRAVTRAQREAADAKRAASAAGRSGWPSSRRCLACARRRCSPALPCSRSPARQQGVTLVRRRCPRR